MNILAIGNSFSDDTLEYVYQIAESAGITGLYRGNLYIGGCSLERHLQNARTDAAEYEYRTNGAGEWSTQPQYRLKDALAARKWDVISMQQASPFSGEEETYAQADGLVSYVRGIAGDCRLVWNMTWAYQKDFTGENFSRYGYGQERMYRAIVNAVQRQILPRKVFEVVPCGTAVQNARTSFLGDTLTRDGYHLSFGAGRYTAGLTFAKAVLGVPPRAVTFVPRGVSREEEAVAKESAENACAQPFAVVRSRHAEGDAR